MTTAIGTLKTMGDVSVLSVGEGDLTLKFDPKNPADLEHAKKVVVAMLKRGYAIFVQVGKRKGEPLYQRAKAFDPKTCEYLITGVPDDVEDQIGTTAGAHARQGDEAPEQGSDGGSPVGEAESVETPPKRKRGRPKGSGRTTRVPAASTRAVSVARSAGG